MREGIDPVGCSPVLSHRRPMRSWRSEVLAVSLAASTDSTVRAAATAT